MSSPDRLAIHVLVHAEIIRGKKPYPDIIDPSKIAAIARIKPQGCSEKDSELDPAPCSRLKNARLTTFFATDKNHRRQGLAKQALTSLCAHRGREDLSLSTGNITARVSHAAESRDVLYTAKGTDTLPGHRIQRNGLSDCQGGAVLLSRSKAAFQALEDASPR